MGSATRQAYRILFTFTNIRLGVWLPHPALVHGARQVIDDTPVADKDGRWTNRPLLLLLWYLMPHPLWDRQADRNH